MKWTQDDVVKYQLTQDGCHNYAVDTMSRADAKELDTQARSVFGTIYHDGSAYSVSIRCEVDNRIAFLMVAGKNDGLEPVLKQLGDAWNPPKKDQSTSSKQPQRSLKASKKRSEKSV